MWLHVRANECNEKAFVDTKPYYLQRPIIVIAILIKQKHTVEFYSTVCFCFIKTVITIRGYANNTA